MGKQDHLNHDSVVQDWQQNAERHDDKNYKFLRSLKRNGSRSLFDFLN